MAENIGRNNQSHVNVKSHDEWYVDEGFSIPDSAKIVIRLKPQNAGCGPEGVLYINMDSLEKLAELQESIREFLKHQKPKVREYRRSQKLAEKENKKMYG